VDFYRLYEIIAGTRALEGKHDLEDAEWFGKSWPGVLAARRRAAEEARQRRDQGRPMSYQLPVPGINPTLMSLRGRVTGPGPGDAPFSMSPRPAPLDQATQLALFEQGAIGVEPTAASALRAAVVEAQAAQPERGSRGTRMATTGQEWPLLLNSLGLMALGGLGIWAGSQRDQTEREQVAA
jgi:hypothetical protein